MNMTFNQLDKDIQAGLTKVEEIYSTRKYTKYQIASSLGVSQSQVSQVLQELGYNYTKKVTNVSNYAVFTSPSYAWLAKI